MCRVIRDQSLAKEGYDVITFTLSGDWVFLEPVDNQQEITSSNDNWYFRLSFDPEDSLQISQDPLTSVIRPGPSRPCSC